MSRRAKILSAAAFVLLSCVVVASLVAWSHYTTWRISHRDAERDAAAALERGDWQLLRGAGRLGSPGVPGDIAGLALARCGARSVPVGDVLPWSEAERAWYSYASAYNAALLRSAPWSDRCLSASDAPPAIPPSGR
jgi:hypothetical protein